MASPTQWTWMWANSGRQWRTEELGVLQSFGLQRVRYDLNDWTTTNCLEAMKKSIGILIRSPLYFFPRTGYWCKLGQSEILHHGPLHGILNLNWILNRRTMILKVWIVGFPSHIAKFLDHTVLHMWFHCNSCFLAFHSFYKPPSTCLWFKLAESLSIAYN